MGLHAFAQGANGGETVIRGVWHTYGAGVGSEHFSPQDVYVANLVGGHRSPAKWTAGMGVQMKTRSFVALSLAAGLWAAAAAADDALQRLGATQAEVLRAGGDWGETKLTMGEGGQRWNVDALRSADNQIRGRIAVSGSTLFEAANVEARLSGRGVVGKLLDDEGKELAEFEGRVTAAGASGTYQARTGETGEWKWEGQLQQRVP